METNPVSAGIHGAGGRKGNVGQSACVFASIVTYHPDLAALDRLISALRGQVRRILVVDNGSGAALSLWVSTHFERADVGLFCLGDNHGVAFAHNLAVEQAFSQGASHVILFDQDSLPAHDMVSCLLVAEKALLNEGRRVAAVGPHFWDPRFGFSAPFIELVGWRVVKHFVSPGEPRSWTSASYLITSGSLIRKDSWGCVGPLDESFFIDYVDIEWGLRASALGLNCYGVWSACMQHSLGEAPISFLKGWKMIPVHSPMRHYYHFRNAVLLYRRDYVSMKWKLNDGYRLILKFVFYGLYLRNRIRHLNMMLRGVYHGFLGRSGSLEQTCGL